MRKEHGEKWRCVRREGVKGEGGENWRCVRREGVKGEGGEKCRRETGGAPFVPAVVGRLAETPCHPAPV